MSGTPVKLPAIFTKAETLADSAVKMIFVTRELGGSDVAQLFEMKGSEIWLLLAPDDVYTDQDVPADRPEARKRKNTPSQRLRFTMHAYFDRMGAPGDFETWYSEQMDKLARKYQELIDDLDRHSEESQFNMEDH